MQYFIILHWKIASAGLLSTSSCPSRRNFLDLSKSHDLKRPAQGGRVATSGYTTTAGTIVSETILHQKYLFITASRSVSKIIKSATLGLSMIAEEQILSFNLQNHDNTNFSIKYKLEMESATASSLRTNNTFVRPVCRSARSSFYKRMCLTQMNKWQEAQLLLWQPIVLCTTYGTATERCLEQWRSSSFYLPTLTPSATIHIVTDRQTDRQTDRWETIIAIWSAKMSWKNLQPNHNNQWQNLITANQTISYRQIPGSSLQWSYNSHSVCLLAPAMKCDMDTIFPNMMPFFQHNSSAVLIYGHLLWN